MIASDDEDAGAAAGTAAAATASAFMMRMKDAIDGGCVRDYEMTNE